MILEAFNIPVWKTRDYSLDIAKLNGVYRIYLKRLGKYYMKNEHGIKMKFSAKNSADEVFYDKAYADQSTISLGTLVVVSTGSNPIINSSIKL